MFYFYNHRNDTSPNFRGKVAGVACLSPKSLPDTVIECGDLHEATHGAVHLDEDEIQTLKTMWELNANHLILLRVSEGGKADLSKGQHVRWDKVVGNEQRHAFILNVRDYSALTEATLSGFCSLTTEQAEKVYNEELESLPLEIKRLFTRKSAQHLVALDILCQGYLAAHGLIEVPTNCKSGVAGIGRNASIADSTKQTSWWLRGLGVSGLRQLEDALIDAFVPREKAKEIVESLRKGLKSKADQTNPICKIKPLLKEYLS